MTFGFLVGFRIFMRLFWVSSEVFVLHGQDCIHCVVKSCTTTAYRWLLRDSLSSLRIWWSTVIKSPKFPGLGTTVPARLLQKAIVNFRLQADIAMWVFREVSVDTVLVRVELHLCSTPLVIHENNWKCLEVLCSGFLCGSKGLRSSTKFSLNSCSQSGNSWNRSLCTSSRPIFLFVFSVSVDPCTGFSITSHSYFHFFQELDFRCFCLRQLQNLVMKKMLKK